MNGNLAIRKVTVVLLAAFAVSLGGCRTLQYEASGALSPSDREIVSNASTVWDRLFNPRDILKLAEQYAENAVSMPPTSPTIHGRKAILAEFEKFFRENEGRHKTEVDEIIGGTNWAIEKARYTMHIKSKSSGAEVIETGRHVMCRRKISGAWFIVWEIWNSDAPPPK
jgi:ketosteroid isomerase-like protein